MSPYMIGPYYKPQLTSILSITSRLTGVFMTVVSMPLLLWWVVALAAGPEAYAVAMAFFRSLPGTLLVLVSTLFLCYHLMNGIRHLIWDTGKMLSLRQIYVSGWSMLAGSIVLFLLVWRAAA